MHALVMAGGVGERFWPHSRERVPKQFLKLLDSTSMIRATVLRIGGLIRPEKVWVVTNARYAKLVARELPEIPKEQILEEPLGRNTAPCIGLGVLAIRRAARDEVVAVFPADHVISGKAAFHSALRKAERVARETGALVTIGIPPSRPETGYGYIQYLRDAVRPGVYRIKTFAEKPHLNAAKRFLKSGDFFWNSGIFVWTVEAILREIEEALPELHDELMLIDNAMGTAKYDRILKTAYQRISSVSIDYGVMEKAAEVYVVRGKFKWSDLGSWDALYDFEKKDENANVIRAKTVMIDSRDCFIYSSNSSNRVVAGIGLKKLVVIDTGDVLLICDKRRSQEVREIVEKLRREGLKKYS